MAHWNGCPGDKNCQCERLRNIDARLTSAGRQASLLLRKAGFRSVRETTANREDKQGMGVKIGGSSRFYFGKREPLAASGDPVRSLPPKPHGKPSPVAKGKPVQPRIPYMSGSKPLITFERISAMREVFSEPNARKRDPQKTVTYKVTANGSLEGRFLFCGKPAYADKASAAMAKEEAQAESLAKAKRDRLAGKLPGKA